jgi:hypothetical protein
MLFIQLLQILEVQDKGLIDELDWRYISGICIIHTADPLMTRFRQIPTFGPATIRKFSANSLEMKQMAARNFKDLLQVMISPP